MTDKGTESNNRGFDLESWLDEGMKGLRDSLKGKRRQMLPEEFRTHTRAARKEMLLAVRSLMDAAIKDLEQETGSSAK